MHLLCEHFCINAGHFIHFLHYYYFIIISMSNVLFFLIQEYKKCFALPFDVEMMNLLCCLVCFCLASLVAG